ncbi:hypothetical protein [Albirhodobacter sp. R86504]|uniref:hypothetical protein n=1 Tax=Albirhodobacter sp. R86504 TaxID=3093848 RepID=UPI00366ECCAE
MTPKLSRFSKRATATLLAGALALGMTTPSFAASDGQKAVNTILGLAALGLIIHEIDKKNDSKRSAPAPRRDDRGHDDERRDGRRDGYRDGHRDDPREPRRDARLIRVPAACVMSVQGRNGRSQAVSQDCLTRSRFEGRMPRACAFDIRTKHDGRRTVYGTSCLERNGFHIGR